MLSLCSKPLGEYLHVALFEKYIPKLSKFDVAITWKQSDLKSKKASLDLFLQKQKLFILETIFHKNLKRVKRKSFFGIVAISSI